MKSLARRTYHQLKSKLRAGRSMLAYLPHARSVREQHKPFPADGKRVVAVQLEAFDKGGLEEVVLTLTRHLAREGTYHLVIFVAGSDQGHVAGVARDEGLKVIGLDYNPLLLRQLIDIYRVDLVSLHYSVWGLSEYQRAGVPAVYTIHNTYVWSDDVFVAERAPEYARITHFLAVSDPVARFFSARVGVAPQRITTVPNGLDPALVSEKTSVTRDSLGLADDDLVFLNVASFNWYKFHVLMIAAMKRVVEANPRAKLLLVGNTHDQRCREHAEREIERAGLGDSIRILEYVPKPMVLGLMELADCFLLPSLIEGWSIAVLEAMYCNMPMILSDVGSAATVIQNEDLGMVVRNPFPDILKLSNELIFERYAEQPDLDNLDDLVEAMQRFLQDPSTWQANAKSGHRKVLDQYSASNMCAQYVEAFDRAISGVAAND